MPTISRVAKHVAPHVPAPTPNLAIVPVLGLVCAAAFMVLTAAGPLHAGSIGSTDTSSHDRVWYKTRFSTTRLLGGRRRTDGIDHVFAGVEITLNKGWKTYWRQPGTAGGVPPSFNWSRSTNIASLKVLYPAPQRFRGINGTTVGYKNHVLFPLEIVPVRASEPVKLELTVQYGICSSICVPVHEELAVTIPPGSTHSFPTVLNTALKNVPHEGTARTGTDPSLRSHKFNLDGPKPEIVFQVDFKGSTDGTDAFVDITGDFFLPVARPRPDLGPSTFAVDLSKTNNLETLRGQTLTVTLVSPTGHSATHVEIK